MHLLFVLTIIFFVLYIILSSLLLSQWRKIPSFEAHHDFIPITRISVIVPVRNEAEHIATCVQSILQQDYPKDLFEIIVVDDQSYDETPELLEKMAHPLLQNMRLGVGRKTTIEGSKKKAISYGVNHAQGDLIVTTDGDCILPSAWLKNIASFYEKTKAKLIVAPVISNRDTGAFHAFVLLDTMNTFFIQAAGIQSRLFYLCSGANLAYEKKAFLESNPYETNMNIASGDDIFLLEKFKINYPDEIKILKSTQVICLTNGPSNLRQLFKQRFRWASKMKKISDHKPQIIAAIVWMNRVLPWFSLFISYVYQSHGMRISSIGIILVSFILDFSILYQSVIFFKKKYLLKWFIPAEFLYSFYFFILGLASQLPLSLEWKDRKL